MRQAEEAVFCFVLPPREAGPQNVLPGRVWSCPSPAGSSSGAGPRNAAGRPPSVMAPPRASDQEARAREAEWAGRCPEGRAAPPPPQGDLCLVFPSGQCHEEGVSVRLTMREASGCSRRPARLAACPGSHPPTFSGCRGALLCHAAGGHNETANGKALRKR